MIDKSHFSIFLIAVTGIAVVACSPNSSFSPIGSERADSSEELLAAEGSWSMVEEKQSPTPEQQHMSARKQVSPNQILKSSRKYTKHVTASDLNEETHFRVLRLERQVAGLEDDFKKILPPLSNLIVSDDKLDQSIAEIQKRQQEAAARNSQKYASAATDVVPAPAPAHKPVAEYRPDSSKMERVLAKATGSEPKPTQQSRSDAGGPVTVTNLRLGEHPGKTRVVLDLNAPGSFKIDVDNNEKLLLVELPSVSWSAEMQKSLSQHPLVKGYTAQPSGDKTTLALELAKPARVIASSALKPNHIHGHRIFFDVAAL